MSDLDRKLGDLVADERISDEDAQAVLAFRDFLSETPPNLTRLPGDEWPAQFADRETFEAWRVKWLPYVHGVAEGPSTAEEWPAYREQILASQEPA